jgi:hypothetical protein
MARRSDRAEHHGYLVTSPITQTRSQALDVTTLTSRCATRHSTRRATLCCNLISPCGHAPAVTLMPLELSFGHIRSGIRMYEAQGRTPLGPGFWLVCNTLGRSPRPAISYPAYPSERTPRSAHGPDRRHETGMDYSYLNDLCHRNRVNQQTIAQYIHTEPA